MPPERAFDLKLKSGRIVTWSGADELDAARRYVDSHRDQVVIATREHVEKNIVAVLARGYRIIEPGDRC